MFLTHTHMFVLLLSSILSYSVWAGEDRDPRLAPPGGTTPAYPSYADGILYLPRIDTPEGMATYQDVKFAFDEPTGSWQLTNFMMFKPARLYDNIKAVEVLATETLPIQVFLKLRVEFSDSCLRLGQINQQLSDNKLEVIILPSSITYLSSQLGMPLMGGSCWFSFNEPIYKYEKIIPLDVYGLAAGTYEYDVNNGQFVGTFSLSEDNVLDVCALTGEDCAEAVEEVAEAE